VALITLWRPNRRDFLRGAVLFAGLLLAGGCSRLQIFGPAPSKTVRWAILADTHISPNRNETILGFRVYDNFKAVVEQIREAAPEGAIICGDIARRTGLPGDYAMVREIIEPIRRRMSLAFVLGNHDDRDNFLKAFPENPGQSAGIEGKHVQVIELESAGISLVLLDSLGIVEGPGELGSAQLQWLAQYLDRNPRQPALLFAHHRLGETDRDQLLEVILPRKQVKAFFYGHQHRYLYEQIDGLHVVNIPAVAATAKVKEPLGWVEAELSNRGGRFTLHAIANDTSLDKQVTTLQWR